MQKINSLFLKHRFAICVVLILLLASFLRFYNYENRWGLAYDQARDLLVASESVKTFQIPLIGPFTSAGPFVYGPQWFWILILLKAIAPSSVIFPWIVQSFLYVITVLIMIYIGKEIENKPLGIILGLLTAVSTAQIAQSTNLISPSMTGIFSIISLFFLIRFINYGKKIDAFLMGLSIGTAINIHFQALGLLSIFPTILILKRNNLKAIFVSVLGLGITFIPLILFDLSTNFFESRNLIDYYLYGQYRIYVPNRWLTYAGVYWPTAWAKIIGGYNPFGYVMMVLLFITTFYSLLKNKLTKKILTIIISFFMIFVMLRYYRGERFDGYLVFLHPFVLILTAWVCYQILKFARPLGLIIIIALVIGSLRINYYEIKNSTNNTAVIANLLKKEIVKKFPNQKFAIYAYKHEDTNMSYPLVLFVDAGQKINDNGRKIGLLRVSTKVESKFNNQKLQSKSEKVGYQLFDLSNMSKAELSKEEWMLINPSAVYNEIENWYKQK